MATVVDVAVPPLAPGAVGGVQAELTPLRRGRLTLGGVNVARSDALGVARTTVTVPVTQSLLVLPRRYPVPSVELPGGRKYHQGGMALASSVGDSEEFVALRDYQPGDPLRRIHWRSWAKLGTPIVKEHQNEFFVRHALVLDTFVDTEPSDVFEEAVSVAASLAAPRQRRNRSSTFCSSGRGASASPPGAGSVTPSGCSRSSPASEAVPRPPSGRSSASSSSIRRW